MQTINKKLLKNLIFKNKKSRIKISFINFLSGKKKIKKKYIIGKCLKLKNNSMILMVSQGAKFSCKYIIPLNNPSILQIDFLK